MFGNFPPAEHVVDEVVQGATPPVTVEERAELDALLADLCADDIAKHSRLDESSDVDWAQDVARALHAMRVFNRATTLKPTAFRKLFELIKQTELATTADNSTLPKDPVNLTAVDFAFLNEKTVAAVVAHLEELDKGIATAAEQVGKPKRDFLDTYFAYIIPGHEVPRGIGRRPIASARRSGRKQASTKVNQTRVRTRTFFCYGQH